MKTFYIVIGTLFLILGAIGVVLPGLPTTPFLILTAICYSRGSKRLHAWLLSIPAFGKAIRDWEQNGVIRKPAKILATVMIILSAVSTVYFFVIPTYAIISMVVTFVAVLAFIWSRPSTPPANE